MSVTTAPSPPRQTPLREGLDEHLTTHDGLHHQFIAVEQAHPDEWVDVRSVHSDAAWSAIPEDRCLVDVKQTGGAIGQQCVSTATPRQTQGGDIGWRQGECTIETGVDDRFDLLGLSRRAARPEE